MKIIQIAVAAEAEPELGDTLYALCDDGSVYRMYLLADGQKQWSKLPDLPDSK